MASLNMCQEITSRKIFLVLLCVMVSSMLWIASTSDGQRYLTGVYWSAMGPILNSHVKRLTIISNISTANTTPIEQVLARTEHVNETMVRKRILIQNHPAWDLLTIGIRNLKSCSAKCTLDKSAKNLTNYDAVIFNAVNYPKSYPPSKIPGQIWIYFTIESPYHTHDKKLNNAAWTNVINWTMTYRSDSEVIYPYGRIIKTAEQKQKDFFEITKKKTKLVAWFVSNCNTPGKRGKYVKEMKKTISIDIYGSCGSKKCSRTEDEKCHTILSRDYKFYLSFENSLCVDYITEKVYNYIGLDIVPVVRGAVNYTKFLPDKSYINVADFKSIKHLTDYLHYLDKNNSAYVEYFQWKKHYSLDHDYNGMCELCKKLSNPITSTQVYTDVYSWWHKDMCFKPNI